MISASSYIYMFFKMPYSTVLFAVQATQGYVEKDFPRVEGTIRLNILKHRIFSSLNVLLC